MQALLAGLLMAAVCSASFAQDRPKRMTLDEADRLLQQRDENFKSWNDFKGRFQMISNPPGGVWILDTATGDLRVCLATPTPLAPDSPLPPIMCSRVVSVRE
jgi:hypothetical protein